MLAVEQHLAFETTTIAKALTAGSDRCGVGSGGAARGGGVVGGGLEAREAMARFSSGAEAED